MLLLRKILLLDYIFYIILFLTIILTIIRLNIKYTSIYNINTNKIIGIVTNINIKEDYLELYIKNKETIIVTIETNTKLNLGDKVEVNGKIIELEDNKTKYLFNYKKYLKRKKIYYKFKGNNIKIIKHNKNIYFTIKQLIINNMTNRYMNTFILGDKNFLEENVKRSFQENGISHLFAISGMHITLLVSIIEKILKRLKLDEYQRYKFISIFLIIYLLLVGLSPSILRGVLFYILFKLNNIYYFYIKPINLFILVLSIALLINPNYIFDVGFQYSYLISFSLLTQTNKLQSNKYLISLLKVSIISFITSLPITLYNFNQINLLSILYNLFYVPLVSIIIFPLTLITYIIKPLEPIYNIFILILEKSSLLLMNINSFKLIFKRLPLIIYFIYLILIIIYLLKNNKIYIYILLILLSIHYLIPYIDRSDYLKMIDVGQGDSILLHSNNKNILVDTGGLNKEGNVYFNTLYPIFKSEGIKKIDYLILTHGDKDHLGDSKTLIDNFKVKNIIINSNYINYYERKILSKKTIIATEGLNIKAGDFNLIQLNKDLKDENDSSQVYLVTIRNNKILLTGDASKKTEKYILENYDLPKIDILKVGHHGSKTSTSIELLEQIEPEIALISCGKDNKFNHPNQETLEVLSNIKTLRTDILGTIDIFFKRNGYMIK